MTAVRSSDSDWMRLALRLARRARGRTSPNPMVGAVLVREDRLLGQGWHRRAGGPHAEIEALRDAERRGHRVRGATLYVTLEPCSTHGRTPPCTEAIRTAGVKRVVAAATDPNPAHAGRAFGWLRRAGVEVVSGVREEEATRLNEAFNHWIVHRLPFVTLKAAMTLDGKIATRGGESKWITSEPARRWAMRRRLAADAILVGVNTVLADDPSLTVRRGNRSLPITRQPRRIVLDSRARTPLDAKLVTDPFAERTLVITTERAPARRERALAERVRVIKAPAENGRVDLAWLLAFLGREELTHLLVEGGGAVQGAFADAGLVQRLDAYYAPLVVGGSDAPRAVAGRGARSLAEALRLEQVVTRRLGPDLFLTARVHARQPAPSLPRKR